MQNPISNAFLWNARVYFEDTDAGGVVYHANYLKFFERARTEFLRSLGWNQNALLEMKTCAFVVLDLSIQFKRPAKLDDELQIRTVLKSLKRASFVFDQKAFKGDLLMAAAEVRVVCIDPVKGLPKAIPSPMFETIENLLTVNETETE